MSDVAKKSIMWVAIAFGTALLIYNLLGGSATWFESEKFGVLGWVMLSYMVAAGFGFWLIHKKG